VSACAFPSSGPLVTTHAAFICGRPQIFEIPLKVKASPTELAAKV
jgi:hypothetical protein